MSTVVRTCAERQRCVVDGGSTRCDCALGTIPLGDSCEIATSCAGGNGGCDRLTMCSVNQGARMCTACPPGYTGTGESGCIPLLVSLVMPNAPLTPEFSSDTHAYRTQLSLLQQRLVFKPQVPAGVKVEVNGYRLPTDSTWTSPVLPLGETQIELVLTSEYGVSNHYALTVLRSGAQEAYLKASQVDPEDDFGYGVAISGNTLVIGAVFEDSRSAGVNGDASNNDVKDSGAAYVFVRHGDVWTQEAYLKADAPAPNDFFGVNVAISGDTIAVGTTRSSPYGNVVSSRNGLVYIFERKDSAWTQQAKLSSGTSEPDLFGIGIALRGDRLVVGAPYDNSQARQSGAIYVFDRMGSGSTWSAATKLKAAAPQVEALLGWSVAVDGDNIIAGAPQDTLLVVGPGGRGGAHVFVRRNGSWAEQQRLQAQVPEDADVFGYSVAILGDRAVVGSPRSSPLSDAPNGQAFVFDRAGDHWSASATLAAPNPRGGDAFGTSVLLSNDALVIGASGDSSGARGVNGNAARTDAEHSGAVYVYGYQTDGWVRSAYLKSSNAEAGDWWAEHAALDGDTLVVTSIIESSASTGVNGDDANNGARQAGAAYVFR